MMISFESDYNQGAHEKILEALIKTNYEYLSGYGDDKYCKSAKEKIRNACNAPDADVYFLVGGTQTNQTVIDTMLSPYEGVIAADSGHISTHEAGAIEITGHKVLTVSHENGKVTASAAEKLLKEFYSDENHEHAVFPGMIYISNPTEYGTLYTLEELEALAGICRKYKILLYMDGARLGYGLESSGNDLTLPDIARLCDAFYIGGTKVGALCGEAVVFPRHGAPKHFMTQMKQHGALLAKGRVLGIQFDTLFTDNLYFEISRNAIVMADKLRKAFIEKGYEIFIETTTNQIFIVLENNKMESLGKKVSFGFWEKKDENHTVVRFAVSWATKEADIDKLIDML